MKTKKPKPPCLTREGEPFVLGSPLFYVAYATLPALKRCSTEGFTLRLFRYEDRDGNPVEDWRLTNWNFGTSVARYYGKAENAILDTCPLPNRVYNNYTHHESE